MLIFNNIENLKGHNEGDFQLFQKHIELYLDENHGSQKEKKDFLLLDIENMSKTLPYELMIYDNAVERHEEFHLAMIQIVELWCGHYRDVYYKIPENKTIPTTHFENVNHHKVGKLLRLKGIVDNYQTFIAVPRHYIYECNKCGKTYIRNIEIEGLMCECANKIKKYSRLRLNSRMYFNIMEHTEGKASNMILCYFEVADIEYENYLFNSSMVGEYIEVLGCPKKVETMLNKKIAFSFEIEVKGLKPLKKRYVSEKRKKEVIEIIKEDEDAFKNVALSMTKQVYGHDIMKQLVLAVGIGLQKPDADLGKDKNPALHLMVVGDPSIGKSFTAKQFLPYFHKSTYIQGVSSTAVGLLGGCDKNKQGGFIIRSGQVQKSSNSFLILDEMDKIKEDTMKGLFTALSEGTHTLTNITGSHRFEYNTSFILIANPKEGKFDLGMSKYAQIDLDPAFMSRVDLIHIPKKPYMNDNFEIDHTKYAEYQKYRSGRKYYDAKYNEEFCLDYAEIVKEFPNPKITDEVKIYIEKYCMEKMVDAEEIAKKKEEFYINAQDLQRKPIDERFMNTIIKISKIIARARFSSNVQIKDLEYSKNLVEKGMLDSLLSIKIEDLNAMTKKIEMAKLIDVPVTKNDKIRYIKTKLSKYKLTSEEKLKEIAKDVEIGEVELDEIVELLQKNQDIYSPKPRNYLLQ
jgi:DNA replicative helicase MCM subunit Mcm2 (Cdc46/Mcm family)